MNSFSSDHEFVQFDNIGGTETPYCNNSLQFKKCKKCITYTNAIFLLLGIYLILMINVYTAVILQLFFNNIKSVFAKLDILDYGQLLGIYKNISLNTQIMCENDYLIKEGRALCYSG